MENYEKGKFEWGDFGEEEYFLAQYSLGDMYYSGKGVEQDYAQALALYRIADSSFNDDTSSVAQYKIGTMYENGEGVEQDYAEALSWYSKAADQGNIDAQKALKRLEAALSDTGHSQE